MSYETLDPVVIRTGGLRPGDPQWDPLKSWLVGNGFDLNAVPVEASIRIVDGTCLEVECYVRNKGGQIWCTPNSKGEMVPVKETQRRPLRVQPPEILLD